MTARDATAPRLRVALDMTSAVIGMTGVRRYGAMALDRLTRRPDLDVRTFALGRARQGAPRVDRRVPVPLRVAHPVWSLVDRPRAETLVGGADVVHSLGGRPPATRRPLVMTVHDLLPLREPQFFTSRIRREAEYVARAVVGAAVVVTTCDATALEISTFTGLPLEHVIVAPPGPRELPPAGRSGLEPEGPYVLAIGAVTPRKGLDTLAAAVARLGPSAPPVLVAGPDGLRADDVRRAVSTRDVHARFSFLGGVDDDALAQLLAHATVVCHPSRAEGFGIVCLEAMAYGRPVVATDLPSVRELGADGLALVPVDDPAALASVLDRLLDDEAERSVLGARARAAVSGYSWERFADALVAAYERAAARTMS